MTDSQDYKGTADIAVLQANFVSALTQMREGKERIAELEAALDGLLEIADPAWNPIAFANARAALTP
jgi:hypothetical protein